MVKILSFLRLTAKFLAVLRLTVNPIETLKNRSVRQRVRRLSFFLFMSHFRAKPGTGWSNQMGNTRLFHSSHGIPRISNRNFPRVFPQAAQALSTEAQKQHNMASNYKGLNGIFYKTSMEVVKVPLRRNFSNSLFLHFLNL